MSYNSMHMDMKKGNGLYEILIVWCPLGAIHNFHHYHKCTNHTLGGGG